MNSEKISKASQAYGLLKTSFKYQTKEFFNNSTLHGVRYIAEKGRSFGEKFMWFCFVSIGAVAAFVIIGSLWEKFQTNPTITGLDTDFHNQQVLFPTVTICPIIADNLEETNETSEVTTEAGFGEFTFMLKTLPRLSYETLKEAYETLRYMPGVPNFDKDNLRQLAFKVGVKCEDLLEICKYKDEEISCCEYFLPLYSEHGLCYSFNSRYFGSPEQETKNNKINDLFETDKKWALTFVPTRSSKVFLHSSDEVTSHDFRPTFIWDVGHSIELLITMKQTYTTEDARQLSVGQRKCIFPDEIRLEYYKDDIYSFSACMKHCRMKRVNKLCKCIPPFYAPATGSYRQCGLDDFSCLLTYRENITDIRGCRQCELSCLNTVYDIEKFTRTIVPESSKREEFCIHIEFLTWPIIRYKREVLFGWVDLLVSFGGIAGLFLGFSLLSGVEIIYYFTLRASCMIYRNREELYALQEEDKLLSKAQYDLGLWPKLKESDKRKSFSMPNFQTVRPVESAGNSTSIHVRAFHTPKDPIKKRFEGQMRAALTVDDIIVSRLHKFDGKSIDRKRPIIAARRNLFHPNLVAPYNQRIRPLDKRFRLRSQSEGPEVMYDGYLP